MAVLRLLAVRQHFPRVNFTALDTGHSSSRTGANSPGGRSLPSPSHGTGNGGRPVTGLARGVAGGKCGCGSELWSGYREGRPALRLGSQSAGDAHLRAGLRDELWKLSTSGNGPGGDEEGPRGAGSGGGSLPGKVGGRALHTVQCWVSRLLASPGHAGRKSCLRPHIEYTNTNEN